MATATVKLTADNMGDATEQDFDNWVEFVNERIDEKCGFSVEVDSFRFANSGAAENYVSATEEQTETIREAIERLWDDWCSEGAPGATA